MSEGMAKRVEIDGRRRYFGLRDTWSAWIIAWISSLIFFNIAITVCVGLGVLVFTDLEWFISAVLVQTFLQIVGLGFVAVRYLFKDD